MSFKNLFADNLQVNSWTIHKNQYERVDVDLVPQQRCLSEVECNGYRSNDSMVPHRDRMSVAFNICEVDVRQAASQITEKKSDSQLVFGLGEGEILAAV